MALNGLIFQKRATAPSWKNHLTDLMNEITDKNAMLAD